MKRRTLDAAERHQIEQDAITAAWEAEHPEPSVIQTIDLTPTWEETARMLVILLEAGDHKGKAFARTEVVRMGQIIDHMQKNWKAPSKESAPAQSQAWVCPIGDPACRRNCGSYGCGN